MLRGSVPLEPGAMIDYLGLGPASRVIGIGSLDGCLLEAFRTRGIPVLGLDPDPGRACETTRRHAVPTLTGAFDAAMALRLLTEGIDADLVIAPDLLETPDRRNEALAGLAALLRREGVAMIDVRRRMTLRGVERLVRPAGLRLFDGRRLPGRTGRLRLLACRHDSPWQRDPALDRLAATPRFTGGIAGPSGFPGPAP